LDVVRPFLDFSEFSAHHLHDYFLLALFFSFQLGKLPHVLLTLEDRIYELFFEVEVGVRFYPASYRWA
jgi:hypothetical protein